MGQLRLCRYSFSAMGSPCEIRIYSEDAAKGASAIQHAVSEVCALENKYSRYKPDSILSQVNAAAARGESIHVDDEFIALFNYADACFQQSDGLFDITSGALRFAWDFSNLNQISIPSQEKIEQALAAVGWESVSLESHILRFLKPNMSLDFGGIVKEYAADCAAKILKDQGVAFGLVNLGGDIKAVGPHPNGEPWEINVKSPDQSGHVAVMHLHHEGLATSGDYERCFEIDGVRYSHLLSPKTGWPVKGLTSVTVKAPQCVVAGSAATIAMLKGQAGRDWLEGMGVEHVAV